MKHCYSCKQYKNLKDFYKNKARYDGLDSRCKTCRLQYKASRKDRDKAYYQQNKSKFKEYKLKNKEFNKEYFKQYYQKNKKVINLQNKASKAKNPARVIAVNKLIKFKKLKRTPKWLSKAQIKEIQAFYELANLKSRTSDIQYHVDHIIPLNGKNVSGLHVPWNLQILEKTKNLEKSNKF